MGIYLNAEERPSLCNMISASTRPLSIYRQVQLMSIVGRTGGRSADVEAAAFAKVLFSHLSAAILCLLQVYFDECFRSECMKLSSLS